MEQGMQNNNQNNMHWKTTLEDDTAFAPGELADTGAAWEKLYNRMHQPQRKKKIWYWAAAASLLIAVLFTLVFSVKQQTNNITVNSVPAKQTEKKVQNISSQQELDTRLPGQKAMVKTNTKQAGINTVKYEKQTKKDIIPSPAVNGNRTTIETVTSLPAEKKEDYRKPVSIPLVAVKQKAKLKVVHVNELGENNEDKNNKPGGDYSVIQFGVKSQPVNNNTTSTGKIGLNISTSKTSPSN